MPAQPPTVQLSVNQGDQDVQALPSPVVVLQGLDGLTSEESVTPTGQVGDLTHAPALMPTHRACVHLLLHRAQLYDSLTALGPVLQVRLVRDVFTHTSCGFAFGDYADPAVRGAQWQGTRCTATFAL